MHAVIRTYSGHGAKELFDLLEKRKAEVDSLIRPIKGFVSYSLVRTGDVIELDVAARRLHLQVSDAEMASRRAAWKAPAPRFKRGYGALFSKHISQANDGCDFDFLEGTEPTEDPEIH